eukprot:scaffold58355_cov66-Phaeocystis_antarctica.AAC.9
MSPARAQPTHSLRIHRARCLCLRPRQHPRRCHPRPRTPRGPAATPSFAHGCVARAPCTLQLAPNSRSLGMNGGYLGGCLDDATEQALKAAAGSGLSIILHGTAVPATYRKGSRKVAVGTPPSAAIQ